MKKVFTIIVLVLLAAVAFAAWQFFGPVVKKPEEKFLFVKTGTNYESLKSQLKDEKIINNTFFFDLVAKKSGLSTEVKPGKYEIKNGGNVVNLVRMLKRGAQSPVNFVITKLRTKEDLAARIAKYFETDSATAAQFLLSPDSIKPFGLDTNTAMTIIIPNTYNILWTTPVHKIYDRLQSESEKFWNEGRKSKAAAKNLSQAQVYTMASIIEEETNKKEDKLLIASVYINRIKKGMKLEADPTVKYAMRDFGLKRIMNKHLAYESAYNTYRNTGLPPGPICTPSVETIDAVLDAPETDYLFFVAKPDFKGYSNFAKDYNEHLKYAAMYQKALDSLILRKQNDTIKK